MRSLYYRLVCTASWMPMQWMGHALPQMPHCGHLHYLILLIWFLSFYFLSFYLFFSFYLGWHLSSYHTSILLLIGSNKTCKWYQHHFLTLWHFGVLPKSSKNWWMRELNDSLIGQTYMVHITLQHPHQILNRIWRTPGELWWCSDARGNVDGCVHQVKLMRPLWNPCRPQSLLCTPPWPLLLSFFFLINLDFFFHLRLHLLKG